MSFHPKNNPINLDYPNQELFVGLMNPNLKPFFRDDQRTIILPIDHGTNIPVPDMPAFEGLISEVSEFVGGFVMNLGAAKVFASSLDNTGLCLRTDNYKPDNPTGSYKVCGGDEAKAVAADGMMHMLYPGHENESIITMECAETIAEGLDEDIGVIVESLPFGLGMTDLYTAENIGFAVRQAAELGADVVKTASPTDASLDEFKAIIDACFVPVGTSFS